MKKSFTVRDLPEEERPRERLYKFGPEALSSQELLAIVLSRGIRGESVTIIAQKLLSNFGSLSSIKEASFEDLKQIKGVGYTKAAQIKACFELARRLNHNDQIKSTNDKKREILSSRDIYQLVKQKISNFTKEHLIVLSFDNKNKLLGMDTITVGTLNASLIHPREIFESAIRRHASRIIIVHNHPSGDTSPSIEDIKITKQLVNAGKIMDIEVLDHLIIGDGYKSIL